MTSPSSLRRLEDLTNRLTTLRDRVRDEYEFFWNSTLAILVVADKSYWIKANPSMVRVLGYSLDELLSTSWRDLLHPDDKTKTIDRAIKTADDGGNAEEFVARFKKKDGTYAKIRWKDTGYVNGYYCAVGEHMGDEP